MSKKTSFKQLLGGVGSNPLVNLQGVRAQRQKLDELRAPKRPAAGAAAAAAAPPPKRAAPKAALVAYGGSDDDDDDDDDAPPQLAAPAFEPAGAFLGARPGYAFRMGDRGLGYYSDGRGPAASGRLIAAALRKRCQRAIFKLPRRGASEEN